MRTFVRISAVPAGLANLVVYLYVASSEALLGDDAGGELPWSALLALTLRVLVVGRLPAEILLRFLGSALRGKTS